MKRSNSIVLIIEAIALLIAVALFSSCPNPFADKSPPPPNATGSITVRSQSSVKNQSAKTLRPTADTLQVATYYYHLEGPGNATLDGSDTTGTKTFYGLSLGSWTVAVTAKNASSVILLFSSAVGFTVTQGQTASVIVPLLAETGTGTISITVILPIFVTAVTGTIENEASPGSPISINSKISFFSGSATYQDTVSAGTYSLLLYLKNSQGNTVGIILEDVDVFAGITTNPTLALRDSDLNQPPVAPTGLIIGNPTLSSLAIGWDTVLGAMSYQLYRDTDSGGSFNTPVFCGLALGYTDTGLTAGTTYYYKIKATNAFGAGALSAAASGATEAVDVMIAINAAGDSFMMGDDTFGPQPNVTQTISYNYQMSKYEITNAQFAQFIAEGGYSTQSYWTTNGWTWKGSETQPALWTNSNFNGPNQPVVGISWYEAVAFCNWRSIKESLAPAYNSSGQANLNANGYRLPTDVEWEYAAAKGAPGQAERIYAWGDTWDANKAVCSVSPASASKSADVGSKSPNGDTPQGLTDISGNVWEWCSDNYQGSVTSEIDRYFFMNDSTGAYFNYQGGQWGDILERYLRGAFWNSSGPNYRINHLGFRIVRHAATPAPAAPSGLTASNLSTSSIRLAWTDNSTNEVGFKVERSLNGTSGWTEVTSTAAGVITWDNTGLSEGTTYYYRVKAWNGGGDSDYSNVSNATPLGALQMITISAAGDSFQMGDDSYGPQPNVTQTISYNYDMSKYEITNAQFAAFIADGGYSTPAYWTTNGWNYKDTNGWTQPANWGNSNFNGQNQPVAGVSWYEAVAYCNWRSVKEGLSPAYNNSGLVNLSANGYRLPTDVEWEYSASKGAPGQAERIYAWGDTWDSNKAVCSDTKPADVGSKSPSGDTPQGLADMSGNEWEWCSDNWISGVTGQTDWYYFVDDMSSRNTVLRGGSWKWLDISYYRCAFRNTPPLSERIYSSPDGIGFRVVRRAATPVPAAPSGLTASPLSVSSIRLAWTDNSSNEVGFKVERSPSGSSGWTQVGTTAAGISIYDDTGLTAATYYYRVKAYNGGGDSGYSSAANSMPIVASTATNINGILASHGLGIRVVPMISYDSTATYMGMILTSYAMSETEVTQGDYQAVMLSNPASGYGVGASYPVYYVTWFSAVQFCNALSTLCGLDPVYNESTWEADFIKNGFYLPTEAEWEYAAGGPNHYTWSLGNTFVASDYVFNDSQTRPVKSHPANGFGLYDMGGNVWEWCHDWWGGNYPYTGQTDPNGPTSGSYRVARGGCWADYVSANLRCDYRYYNGPSGGGWIGIRVAIGGHGLWGPTPAPAAPSGLSASPLSTTSIRLIWTDNSSNEVGFKVERSPNGSSGWMQIGTKPAGITIYDDTGLTSGTTYYYRVKAYNGGGDSAYSNTSSCNTYSSGSNWTCATSSAAFSARVGHKALVFNDKMWVIAGQDSTGVKNDVWYSTDGTNWTCATSAAAFSAREFHEALVFNNKMWIIAGQANDGSRKNDVWYSTDGTNWTEATSSAAFSARLGHEALVYDNKMWVIAGHDGMPENDVWYSADGTNWICATSSAAFPTRFYSQPLVFDNKMWVIAGMYIEAKNDIWYSADGTNWTAATSSTAFSGREEFQALVFDNKMWVIGGYIYINPNFIMKNDVWYSGE